MNPKAQTRTLPKGVREESPSAYMFVLLAKRLRLEFASRRLSLPEEVANLIVFLCSTANGNITAEQILEGSSTGRSAHVM